MSGEIGLVSIERPRAAFLDAKQGGNSAAGHSEKTAQAVDKEIKKILEECMSMARDTIEGHRDFLVKAADKLLEVETLDEATLGKLWEDA